MIINSYTISNGRADPEIWTVELKMYPDGLVINTECLKISLLIM